MNELDKNVREEKNSTPSDESIENKKNSKNNIDNKIIDQNQNSISLYESQDIFPTQKESLDRIKLFFGSTSGNDKSGSNNNMKTTEDKTVDNLSSSSHPKNKRQTDNNINTLRASRKISSVSSHKSKSKMMSSIISSSRARLNEKRWTKKKNSVKNDNKMEDEVLRSDHINSNNSERDDIETQLVKSSDGNDHNNQNVNISNQCSEEDELSSSSLSSREQRRVDIMQKFPSSYAFVPFGGNDDNDDDSSNNNDCLTSNEESKLLIKETTTSLLKSELHKSSDSMSSSNEESYFSTQSEQQTIINSVQTDVLQNFATEHRIYLRTILTILTEKDSLSRLELENGPNSTAYHSFNQDSTCILISGPVKKASHIVRGVWRVKYAEVRRGVFSYYEDSINSDAISGTTSLKKKSLPLRASMCTCRAVKVTPKLNMRPSVDYTTDPTVGNNVGGAVFELTVEGGPRRLWMTTCREERQAWIHAIHEAMIGAVTPFTKEQSISLLNNSTVSPLDNWELIKMGIPLHYSSYQSDLLMYLSVQKEVKASFDALTYRRSMDRLLGKMITVPVQWIKEQIEVAPDFSSSDKKFTEESINLGIDQLWKDLLRDSVSINNVIYKGDTGHGPERIIGALSRCILEFDSTFGNDTLHPDSTDKKNKSRISPKQAVIYARDILLACNRTRSGGDSYYCLDNLCTNSDMMFLCPYSSEAEPLSIKVSHVTYDDTFIDQDDSLIKHRELNWMMWIKSKTKSQKVWRKLFFVLSQSGVLSFYEKQHPRPHGLKGQLVLEGASMAVSEIPLHSNTSTDSDTAAAVQAGSNLKGFRKFVGSSTPLLCSDPDPALVFITQNSRSLGKRSNSILATNSKIFLIWIRPTDSSKERRFLFDDEEEFSIWKNALEKVLSTVNGSSTLNESLHDQRQQQTENSSGNKISSEIKQFFKNRVLSPTNRASDDFYLTPNHRTTPKPLKLDNIREEEDITGALSMTKCAISDSQHVEESNLKDSRAEQPKNASFTTDLLASSSVIADKSIEQKTNSFLVRYESTVLVEVEASTVYKICTLDPQGDEIADTWFTLQTKFSQNFRLCGAHNGRMFRGEEVVQMSFLHGLATRDSFSTAYREKQLPRVRILHNNKYPR